MDVYIVTLSILGADQEHKVLADSPEKAAEIVLASLKVAVDSPAPVEPEPEPEPVVNGPIPGTATSYTPMFTATRGIAKDAPKDEPAPEKETETDV
jgi:hypothetical protein